MYQVTQIIVGLISLAFGIKFLIARKQGYGIRRVPENIFGISFGPSRYFGRYKFAPLTKEEKSEQPILAMLLLGIGSVLLLVSILNFKII